MVKTGSKSLYFGLTKASMDGGEMRVEWEEHISKGVVMNQSQQMSLPWKFPGPICTMAGGWGQQQCQP